MDLTWKENETLEYELFSCLLKHGKRAKAKELPGDFEVIMLMAHVLHQQPDHLKQSDAFLWVYSNILWATLIMKDRRH